MFRCDFSFIEFEIFIGIIFLLINLKIIKLSVQTNISQWFEVNVEKHNLLTDDKLSFKTAVVNAGWQWL